MNLMRDVGYRFVCAALALIFCAGASDAASSAVFDEFGLVVPQDAVFPECDESAVVEGLKLPLKRYDSGRIKVYVTAEKAWQTGEGGVAARGEIVLMLLAPDGKVDWRMTAQKGAYNKGSGWGMLFGDILAEHISGGGDAVLRCTDLYAAAVEDETSFVATARNADLVLKTGEKGILYNER